MKNKMYLATILTALFVFTLCEYGFSQQDYYDVNAGNGKGIRFYNGHDNYKIDFGNSVNHKYGLVNNYSIKMGMNDLPTRGWTWGVLDKVPVTALNTEGHFQTQGWIKSVNRSYYFGHVQRLYGDNNSALVWRSNNSWSTQIALQDKEGTNCGRLYGAGNGTKFGLLDGDSNWSYLAVKDNYTSFSINNSEKMRILANGNVGIGTDNPSHKLTVESGSGGGLFVSNSNGNSHIPWTDGNIYLTGGELTFRTTGNLNRMKIKSNGNVGIGTITPQNKLDVNGTIRAKEIIVEEGWGDYVFYDDYQLPTLEDEEKHIEENGHLSGFESAENMAGEIQLGDVTKRQQVKIEEVMLHLIEMKKEMIASKNEIVKLKEENKQLKELIIKD